MNSRTAFRLIALFALFFATTACSPKAEDTLTGKWTLSATPSWVRSAYLAHQSQDWQFLNGGTCIFGTATGTYKTTGKDQIKVEFPMQDATPGFVGVFTFSRSGDTLTMKNLAQPEPVTLQKQAK